MAIVSRLIKIIDTMTEWVGRTTAWLLLVAVLVSAINAIVRKVFGTSSNAWLELQWYLYGAVFMLGAAWALKHNAHVRIDVVSSRLTKRSRDWIDLFGHMFLLLPLTIIVVWLSWPDFVQTFLSQEMSYNAGGLVLWPAKALIVAGFAILFLQTIAEILRRVMILLGKLDEQEISADSPAAAANSPAARGQGDD